MYLDRLLTTRQDHFCFTGTVIMSKFNKQTQGSPQKCILNCEKRKQFQILVATLRAHCRFFTRYPPKNAF